MIQEGKRVEVIRIRSLRGAGKKRESSDLALRPRQKNRKLPKGKERRKKSNAAIKSTRLSEGKEKKERKEEKEEKKKHFG